MAQKFSIATKRGLIHSNSFELAMSILKSDFEEKQRELKQKEEEQKLRKEFETLLNKYLNTENILK